VTAHPVRCVLAADDPALVAACVAAAEASAGIQVVASVPRIRVLGGGTPACDVLLIADAPGHPATAWAEDAARAHPGVAIVLLVEDAGVDTYRAALRVGACAVATLPASPAGLSSAVADALGTQRPGTGPRDAPPGEVIAVAGACGGVGTSALALGLAAGCRALLVDLSRGRAGLPFVLGAACERSLADLAQAGEALAAGIGTVASEHRSGLRFVPGPPDGDVLAAVDPGWGLTLVRELRARERVAVIDGGASVEGSAREALLAADRLVVVVVPLRSSLEAGRSLVLDLARWGASAQPELVVNRWSRRADVGLRAVARIVDAPVAAVVRDDPRGMHAYDEGGLDVARWIRTGPMRAVASALCPEAA
jgi:pilus assembly protein CpaE